MEEQEAENRNLTARSTFALMLTCQHLYPQKDKSDNIQIILNSSDSCCPFSLNAGKTHWLGFIIIIIIITIIIIVTTTILKKNSLTSS